VHRRHTLVNIQNVYARTRAVDGELGTQDGGIVGRTVLALARLIKGAQGDGHLAPGTVEPANIARVVPPPERAWDKHASYVLQM